MAYDKTGLQPIGGQAKAGNAPQMWSYTSTDAKTDIDASGYFNDASDLLKVGDLIYHKWGKDCGAILISASINLFWKIYSCYRLQ